MDNNEKEPGEKILTRRFEEALIYASQLHGAQKRKGTSIPYIAHLLGVTALVLEDGGDEDQSIAALLHDAVEDQGGHETLHAIRERFGERVAEIVEGLTDTFIHPKPPWRERKEKYIEHLKHASPEVRRVSLADKLHNARSILADLRTNGPSTWDRFRGGKEGTLWYYHSLLDVFLQHDSTWIVEELARVIEQIDRLSDA
jgi:(p)ppGpp synthase/HD superfamily hydrolase